MNNVPIFTFQISHEECSYALMNIRTITDERYYWEFDGLWGLRHYVRVFGGFDILMAKVMFTAIPTGIECSVIVDELCLEDALEIKRRVIELTEAHHERILIAA